MPGLQNRVTPFGDIIVAEGRGLFMGNRGILHTAQQQVVRRWAHNHWIICRLAFKGRRRALMQPGRYTELFFLDEATALAAGHRPCAECQRERFRAFATACEAALGVQLSASELDRRLHQARLTGWGRHKRQRVFEATLHSLPDGVLVSQGDQAYLWQAGSLRRWTPQRYVTPEATVSAALLVADHVTVLTPWLTVEALRRGYRPIIKESE